MAPAGTVHRSPSRLHFLKPSPNFVNSTFKFKPQQLYTFRNRCRTPSTPPLISINCKLKSSGEIKKQNASKKIELWNSAPPLLEEESNADSGKKEPAKAGSGGIYEAVALGSAGELVGDDDGLEDLAVLLKVVAHRVLGGFPRQPADEDFGQRGVAELLTGVAAHGHDRGNCSGGLTEDDGRREIVIIIIF
ncbi:unnamed protein product [Linum trigynum]